MPCALHATAQLSNTKTSARKNRIFSSIARTIAMSSDEKDMIEISLNEPQHQQLQRAQHKAAANYLSNIRFVRFAVSGIGSKHSHSGGGGGSNGSSSTLAYGQQRDEEEKAASVQGPATPPIGRDATLRQMYCPDCQQRLDASTVVHYEQLFTCCLPLMPLQRLYRSAVKRHVLRSLPHAPRKLYCGKCGCSLGYWEKCA